MKTWKIRRLIWTVVMALAPVAIVAFATFDANPAHWHSAVPCVVGLWSAFFAVMAFTYPGHS
jgi:hypothetical protein